LSQRLIILFKMQKDKCSIKQTQTTLYADKILNYAKKLDMELHTPNNADFSLWKRIKSELSLLLIIQIILFFFVGIHLVYELTIVLIFVLLLSLKRNRIIYQVEFNDDKQKFTIFYFTLVAFKSQESIDFVKLNSKLGMKRYGLGSAITTLEFFNKKQLIGEIRVGDKWQWNEEQLKTINTLVTDLKK